MVRTPAILLSDLTDRDAVVREALERWSGAPETIEHVSDGASFTYRFTAGHQRRFLRLTPPGWRTPREVEGELAYIGHLDRKGIPVARPIMSRRGRRVEAVDSTLGSCLAVVFEEIEGDAEDDVHWSPEQAYEAGRLMARMHRAVRDFPLPMSATRPTWRDELRVVMAELPPDEAAHCAIIARAQRTLARLPTARAVFGMVHFDLSGDNLVWRGVQPTAIDFDDCMRHWHVADLTRTIAYFREQAGGERGPHELAMLDGYRDVNEIGEPWMRLFPFFLRIALISAVAWMLRASRAASKRLHFTAEAEANLRRIIASLDGSPEP